MKESDFEEIMRIQRMMASQVAQEEQTNNKIKLMDIINELVSGPKQVVQKELIIIEAQTQGFTENQVEDILRELQTDNFIAIAGGYIKKV